MPSEVSTLLNVRNSSVRNISSDGLDVQADINSRGEQIVVQGLPPDAELVRLGESYFGMTTTAAAALTTIPSTVGMFCLWNGEPDGGKCYILDSAMAQCSAAGTTTMTATIFGMNNKARVATPTSVITPNSLSGRRTYRGKGVIATGLTVSNDVWMPIGNTVTGATTGALPHNIDAPIKGIIIVPPGGLFSIHIQAVNTTSTYNMGMRWHEVQLGLG